MAFMVDLDRFRLGNFTPRLHWNVWFQTIFVVSFIRSVRGMFFTNVLRNVFGLFYRVFPWL